MRQYIQMRGAYRIAGSFLFAYHAPRYKTDLPGLIARYLLGNPKAPFQNRLSDLYFLPLLAHLYGKVNRILLHQLLVHFVDLDI